MRVRLLFSFFVLAIFLPLSLISVAQISIITPKMLLSAKVKQKLSKI